MRYLRSAFLLATFVFVLTCFATPAEAATIYSNSATGNDTAGSGTVGAPYQTFHKAYTSASSGDVIDLNGTFTWTDAGETGDASTSGYTLAKNLTIRGQGMFATIVQASSTAFTADRSVFSVSAGFTVTIQDMTIRHGVTSGGQRGGGVSNFGTLNVIRTNVTANRYNSTSYYGGGGLFTDTNTTITVSTSSISGNSFIGRYYGSGGLYALQNTGITIQNSTFAHNTSTSDSPNTFAYSYAAPSGGFGTFRFGAGVITNSTFAYNWTNSYGGAIQIYYKDSFKITNSTIAYNSSTYGAGGILYQSEWDGYNLSLKNTILADNTGAGSSNDFHAYDAASGARITDNGYNVVEYSTNKTWSGTGNITGNQASLNVNASLADNDSTQGPQTLALASGSVCIDAGNSSANTGITIPGTDQRGAIRNGATDIGAYEYNGTGLVVNYTFTYAAGAHGTISGTSPQTVSAGGNGSAVTAVPDAGYSFTGWSDASTANPRTDLNASGDISVTASFADTTAPAFSNVQAVAADTSATVTWNTDETASTKVIFSRTFTYDNTTAETDVGTPVTSHSVGLTGLNACTTYRFKPVSRDALLNAATGTETLFVTSGCSSGSGGGGAGGLPASSISPSPVTTFQVSQQGKIITVGRVAGVTDVNLEAFVSTVPTVRFTRDLVFGMKGDDVKLLQIRLNKGGFAVSGKGPGASGQETTYFGNATKNALKRLQNAHGLGPDGILAGKTRQLLNGTR